MKSSPDHSDAPAGAPGVTIGSRYVRALLNRHGVAALRHTALVAEVLGFGYTLAHRRMKGDVAWELEEIETVAAHFGETLATVFATTHAEDLVPAVLSVDGAQVDCRLEVGDSVRDPDPKSLVAVKLGNQWVVALAAKAGVGPCFEVRRLTVVSDSERPRRIAILDDDPDEAHSLAEYFAAQGCEAQAFTQIEPLVAHMRLRPFDSYVIDWVLDEGTAAELLAMIRADDSECPVGILTGKAQDDLEVEAAVAEALATYRLMFFQKPTRPHLIASQMLRAMAGH